MDADTAAELTDAVAAMHFDLPTVPEPPPEPETPDLEKIEDKAERKQAEKEAKKKQKAYDQAVKSREKAIRERQKIIDKRHKKNAQEAERKRKEALKLKKKEDAAAQAAPNNNDKEPARQEVGETEVVAATASPTGPTAGSMRSAAEVSVAESPRAVDGKKKKKQKQARATEYEEVEEVVELPYDDPVETAHSVFAENGKVNVAAGAPAINRQDVEAKWTSLSKIMEASQLKPGLLIGWKVSVRFAL